MTSVTPSRRKYRSSRNFLAATSATRSRFVAARNRTSTLTARVAPSRVTSLRSMTRRSLACVARGISPISSSITVPPWADSMRPSLRVVAPVNAPRSWPNSSFSSSVSLSAAQLSWTSGPLRSLAACRLAARTSLPTPVSPMMRMFVCVPANSRTREGSPASVGSSTRSWWRPPAETCEAWLRATMTNENGPIWKLPRTGIGVGSPPRMHWPSSHTPFVEPRSWIVGCESKRTTACRRDRLG